MWKKIKGKKFDPLLFVNGGDLLVISLLHKCQSGRQCRFVSDHVMMKKILSCVSIMTIRDKPNHRIVQSGNAILFI